MTRDAYRPGGLAKCFIIGAVVAYLAEVAWSGARGADLSQWAFLYALLPVLGLAPAWFAGVLAHGMAPRRPAGRRGRIGDVALCAVVIAEAVALVVAANGR